MSKKVKILLVCLALLVNFSGGRYVAQAQGMPQANQSAKSGGNLISSLEFDWRTGFIGDRSIFTGLVATDLNADGIVDIASCNSGYAYVVNLTSSGDNTTTWYSDYLGCETITSGDRDANGILELYIASSKKLLVYNSSNYELLDEYTLDYSYNDTKPVDLAVSDVDSDGAQEIILIYSSTTRIYDANTFTLEWDAWGNGGSRVYIENIDDDPLPETVVINKEYVYQVHVLNARVKIKEWTYTGDFGQIMGIGDTDADGIAEIVCLQNDTINIMGGSTGSVRFSFDGPGYVQSMAVSDVNADGISELLVGTSAMDDHLSGYRASNGEKLWSITNPGDGVDYITAVDMNHDGALEIVWSAGAESSADDTLNVGTWVDQTVVWTSDYLQGIYYTAAGDIDNDGQVELVTAVNGRTANNYTGNHTRIYNGATYELEAVIRHGEVTSVNTKGLALGQLDGDPALEILVSLDEYSYLSSYDGLTKALEWKYGNDYDTAEIHAKVMNLDGDAVDEIVVGRGLNVRVYNGASNEVQWESEAFEDEITDIDLGDLDGDSVVDLVVSTDKTIRVYETSGWQLKKELSLDHWGSIAVLSGRDHQPGELFFIDNVRIGYNFIYRVSTLDGATYQPKMHVPFDGISIKNLEVADLDRDGFPEVMLMGNLSSDREQSLLWIGSNQVNGFWEYKLDGRLGSISNLALADLDQDGKQELVFGSDNLVQVNEINTAKMPLTTAFVPMVGRSPQPYGIYGTLKKNGVVRELAAVYLRFYDGNYWHTAGVAYTDEGGLYQFRNVQALRAGQYYYVLYVADNVTELRQWHTRSIDSYTAGSTVNIGNFDVGAIELTEPISNIPFDLPTQFVWRPRPVTPQESYEFNLYDSSNTALWVYTNPPLGYTDHYTLNRLPDGFELYKDYSWEIWAYQPDGGYGISFSKSVSFSSAGSGPIVDNSTAPASLPPALRDLPGVESPVLEP